ncbi:MAG: class II glutamine amidotransferase [Nevskia sp.]|nr:class II glutamine amidotransferase [Nevskia sp.]
MCLILHKPAGERVAAELIDAAAAFNRDGWGIMGWHPDGSELIERHQQVDADRIKRRLHELRDAELCLHLRLRTRGSDAFENGHPIKVSERFHLMHNGTLRLKARIPGRSDSWHFAVDLLRPLALNWPESLAHPSFVALVEAGLTPENKVVLLDTQARRLVFFNHRHGVEFEGLWLSSTRWIDRRQLALTHAPQPQQKTYAAAELDFL